MSVLPVLYFNDIVIHSTSAIRWLTYKKDILNISNALLHHSHMQGSIYYCTLKIIFFPPTLNFQSFPPTTLSAIFPPHPGGGGDVKYRPLRMCSKNYLTHFLSRKVCIKTWNNWLYPMT